MIARLTLVASLVVVLAAMSWTGRFSASAAEATPQNQTTPGAGQSQQTQSSMQSMMKMHEQMMAEMKADDARLDALLKDMNAATSNAKVNAVAAVVNELARQHKVMHERMGQMHQQMMGGRGMMMGR